MSLEGTVDRLRTLATERTHEMEWLDGRINRLCARIDEATKTIEILRTEREQIQAVVEAARGLACGADWNKGTHAMHYRPALLAALAALDQERKGGQ